MCRWSLDESATTELTALLTKSKLEITINSRAKEKKRKLDYRSIFPLRMEKLSNHDTGLNLIPKS